MRTRCMSLYVLTALVWIASLATPASSQKVTGSSATSVSAELMKGKLSPADSKPGDRVLLKLKDDVKSNGEVVLRKGTTITGVVKNVNCAEGKNSASGRAQSLMEIEWIAPALQGGASSSLMVAVQSVTQMHPMPNRQENDDWDRSGGANSSTAASVSSTGGGLLGGTLDTVTGAGASAGGVASGAVGSTAAVAHSNAAMLRMPSVVVADVQTSSSLENSLGLSGGPQLFQTGRGEIVTSGGSKQSLDIFSRLNNDTVLTSPSKNFEISSGAQMQLLVGVRRN